MKHTDEQCKVKLKALIKDIQELNNLNIPNSILKHKIESINQLALELSREPYLGV